MRLSTLLLCLVSVILLSPVSSEPSLDSFAAFSLKEARSEAARGLDPSVPTQVKVSREAGFREPHYSRSLAAVVTPHDKGEDHSHAEDEDEDDHSHEHEEQHGEAKSHDEEEQPKRKKQKEESADEENSDEEEEEGLDVDDIWGAFVSSLLMILASEVGDKTFFIAAILSMRHPKVPVASGALSALFFMTVLSAGLGWAVPVLLSREVTRWLAIGLFLFFGVRLLRDGMQMSDTEGKEELEEAREEIEMAEKDEKFGPEEASRLEQGETPTYDKHSKNSQQSFIAKAGKSAANFFSYVFSPTFVQACVMTFVAEWGDRSQIGTIAMAAAKNVYGVTIGAIIGHTICTLIAVMGGALLAERISVKTVTLVGGGLFVLFAVLTLAFPDL